MRGVPRVAGAGRPSRPPGFFQLGIQLEGLHPPLTRVLVVPRKANLGWLHAVLQVALGWTNSHLHQFRVGEALVAGPGLDLEAFKDDPRVQDGRRVTLAQIFESRLSVFSYEYDFGDSWSHRLTLEELPEGRVGIERRAVCVEGARACPPEDCGGVPGYAELLEALGNRRHPEHRRRKQWLGRPFNPEAFSTKDTNLWLAQIPWPRVSAAALGRILDFQRWLR